MNLFEFWYVLGSVEPFCTSGKCTEPIFGCSYFFIAWEVFFCLHASSSSLVSSSGCAVYFHVIPSHMQIKFICWRRTYKYIYHLGDFSSTFGICVELFLSIGHIYSMICHLKQMPRIETHN